LLVKLGAPICLPPLIEWYPVTAAVKTANIADITDAIDSANISVKTAANIV
jgi:hypothetical protein